ncbi:HD domain-containing protein [Roseobacter sp. YSTF-M11]|uniref:HD domain-containing protein n=1 Tax=Roseobacter insulae TaxID=2859783 RepID=A0A9X1FYC7_9RHOB|nr:HD domain-containing protein [Roseobacter insulae]MBW4709592.1 HD domain-containing protein [Roseobacter insulae]
MTKKKPTTTLKKSAPSLSGSVHPEAAPEHEGEPPKTASQTVGPVEPKPEAVTDATAKPPAPAAPPTTPAEFKMPADTKLTVGKLETNCEDPAALIAKASKDKEAPFMDVPEGWTESAVWTGKGYLDVLDPDPLAINLQEVARGLARQYRFGPAMEDDYTVAEHSVGAFRIMRSIGIDEGWDPQTRLNLERAALLHDAPEYLIGDMLSPIKRQCPAYRDIDGFMSRAVETRFGLPAFILECDEVREVDRLACDTEARVFLPKMPAWPGMSDGHPDGICRTTKPAAYFLRVADSLGLR